MTKDPSFEQQEMLAATRRLAQARRWARRELRIELCCSAGFAVAVAALFALPSPQAWNPLGAILCFAVMVLAVRVSFETPFGYTPATQLAFVPMLFCMPMAAVPIAVVAVLAIRIGPDVISGRTPAVRLIRCMVNSWFAVGPALVFAVADVSPSHAGPLLLIAALTAQFAVDFMSAGVYFKLLRGVSLLSQVSASAWVYVIDAGLSAVALVIAEQLHEAPYAVLAVLPLLGLLRMFADERRERLGKLLQLNETYRGTALLLGDVISADDNYTGEHSEGVVGLALAVGDALGLDAERRRNLEFGAMLHDVGKITIPKEIINKPGKLDPHEWAIIKTHPAAGQRMLERVGGFMLEVGDIVRAHHERWDGGGYPDGLAGQAIPLEARIITCCDSWSAMRTDRPYRAAMSLAAATEQMIVNAGSQFDPAVVKAMMPVVAAAEASGVVSAEAPAVAAAPDASVSVPASVSGPASTPAGAPVAA